LFLASRFPVFSFLTIKSEIKTLYDHIVQSQTHLNANQFWEIFKNKLKQLIKEHVPHKIAKVKDSLGKILKLKKIIRKRSWSDIPGRISVCGT
jgi:hypothetical protein